MSCGTPVVAWNDDAGPCESVIPDTNGLLAKPYDIKDLAEKIKKALNKKWDRNNIKKTAEKFSDNAQSKIFVKEIKRIIKNHNP